MEALAVERDDAGGFLTAVLQRMQAERRDSGGVGMTEDSEYSAFFAEPVRVKIEEVGFSHEFRPSSLSSSLCCC